MNDGYSNDDYGRTAAKFVEALRKVGATQDANEVQTIATTGEDIIAIEIGIYYMVKHGLPVEKETAQFALDVCEEDEAGDNQIAAARKALADAEKRAKA
jgi:hypothetical protein